MKLSGNKGEWSELYVLLKLLSTENYKKSRMCIIPF